MSSPALERVVSDYHWIECVLNDEAQRRDQEDARVAERENKAQLAQILRALRLARNVVEFEGRLDERGRKAMRGRLRDSLKSGTGFLSLAQELEFASFGEAAGFSTTLPDASGFGQQDACFEGAGVRWYAECKFLSADAGRKITRRDFYRLFGLVEKDLVRMQESHFTCEAVVVTLQDRLEAGAHLHGDLPAEIKRFCSDPRQPVVGKDFRIEPDHLQGITAAYESDVFHRALQSRFGQNAHACGTYRSPGRAVFFVVRSERDDDASKPILDAMTDAAKQLPRDARGIISLHLQGVCSDDLEKSHLQERLLLATNYFFLSRPQTHVASVHVAAAGEVSSPQDLENYIALSFRNPTCPVDLERSLFPDILSNERLRVVRRQWNRNQP